MIKQLKQSWGRFQQSEPGRFARRYRRNRGAPRAGLRKVLMLAFGALTCLAGLVLLPAPGPGTIVLFIGAGMLAEESLWVARALDWLEVQVRRALKWWIGSGPLGRTLASVIALAVVAAFAWASYRLTFGA